MCVTVPEIVERDTLTRSPLGGVTYRVLEGDNLWKISVKHYGKGSKNLEIYEANRDVMKSEDALRPGMTLRIP